jgi:T-complex protein 1 subunit alpha
MCVDATMAVKRTDKSGKVTFPINTINVLKARGQSTKESMLVIGYALNCTRASEGIGNIIKNFA